MDMISLILLIVRGILAYVFLIAGWSKARHLDLFVREVAEYQLLPAYLIKPFATILPYIEITLGIMLVTGWWIKIVAILAAILYLIFIVAITINLMRGRTPDCGCSGGSAHKKISIRLVMRDFGLLLLSIAIAIYGGGFLAFDSLPYEVKQIVIFNWLLPLTIIGSSTYVTYNLGKQLVRLLSLNS
jgi:Methylamine utilisation protein MauE.